LHGDAFGSLFEAEGLSAADLSSNLPLTKVGGIRFINLLLTSLLIGLVYLPGEYSYNVLRLTRGRKGKAVLKIMGQKSPAATAAFRCIAPVIRSELFRCGAVVLPGSMRQLTPGAEVHYGASLPMGSEMVSSVGELRRAPGVFVVDGAALPRVAAKHHTFTIMANADRVSRSLASAGL
jgi:choline dehydrogenase-like flavoprotein